MRLLLLLCLASVAFANPVNIDLENSEDIDVAELLQDLFVGVDRDERSNDLDAEDDEDAGNALDEGLNAEADDVAVEGKQGVVETNEAEIARFDNYMDAIFRRMNAALRAKLMDPMILNLDRVSEKEKGNKANKGHKRNNREKRDVDETEDEVADALEDNEEDEAGEDTDMMVEPDSETEGRKMKEKKKGGNRNKDGKKKKKKGKGKKKNKGKRKGNNNNKRAKADKEETKKGKKNNKKNNKKEDRKSEAGLNRQRRNNGHNKKGKGGNKKGKEKQLKLDDGKSMGSLTGIATLRRSESVKVTNYDTHKIIDANFVVGPLQLEVSNAYKVRDEATGRNERETRTATATTDEMSGNMRLKVKADGFAHVLEVKFIKPNKVEVEGSLTDHQRRRSNNYVKNSLSRIRPYAAKRVIKMARYVLQAPRVQRS